MLLSVCPSSCFPFMIIVLALDVDRLWYLKAGWSDLKALRHLVPQTQLLQRGPCQFPRAIHMYVCFWFFPLFWLADIFHVLILLLPRRICPHFLGGLSAFCGRIWILVLHLSCVPLFLLLSAFADLWHRWKPRCSKGHKSYKKDAQS